MNSITVSPQTRTNTEHEVIERIFNKHGTRQTITEELSSSENNSQHSSIDQLNRKPKRRNNPYCYHCPQKNENHRDTSNSWTDFIRQQRLRNSITDHSETFSLEQIIDGQQNKQHRHTLRKPTYHNDCETKDTWTPLITQQTVAHCMTFRHYKYIA